MAISKVEKLSSNNLMIVMLLISLIVIGITVLAAKSLAKNISRDNQIVQKKNIADNKLKENIVNAPSLVSDFAVLGDNKSILADALPVSVDFPSLLVTLENMSGASGQRLKSVQPAATVATASSVPTAQSTTPIPKPYQFGVATTGTFDSMIRFIRALETSARPMRIVDAQFVGSGSALSTSFTIETYSQDKATLPFTTEIIK